MLNKGKKHSSNCFASVCGKLGLISSTVGTNLWAHWTPNTNDITTPKYPCITHWCHTQTSWSILYKSVAQIQYYISLTVENCIGVNLPVFSTLSIHKYHNYYLIPSLHETKQHFQKYQRTLMGTTYNFLITIPSLTAYICDHQKLVSDKYQ